MYRITYLSAEKSFSYLDKGFFPPRILRFFPIRIIYYGSVLTVHSSPIDTFRNLSNELSFIYLLPTLHNYMIHGVEKLMQWAEYMARARVCV